MKIKLDENLGHRAQAHTLTQALQPTIARHLWIVEAGRIRIYQDPDEDPLDLE